MRAMRGTPHSTTGETPNLMMLGRELRLPDQLQHQPPPTECQPRAEYVQQMMNTLHQAHDVLSQQQLQIRQENQEEPLLFTEGDLVWLENRRRRKGENPKLQRKFVGPYRVIKAWENHTYTVERQGQQSTQNECRLKLYHACPEPIGQAPGTQEATRRPNMRGATRRRIEEPAGEPESSEILELYKRLGLQRDAPASLPDLPTNLEAAREEIPVPEPEVAPEVEPEIPEVIEDEPTPTPEAPPAVEETPSTTNERPRRETRPPDRYGNNIYASVQSEVNPSFSVGPPVERGGVKTPGKVSVDFPNPLYEPKTEPKTFFHGSCAPHERYSHRGAKGAQETLPYHQQNEAVTNFYNSAQSMEGGMIDSTNLLEEINNKIAEIRNTFLGTSSVPVTSKNAAGVLSHRDFEVNTRTCNRAVINRNLKPVDMDLCATSLEEELV
jgi:hypothetical protein